MLTLATFEAVAERAFSDAEVLHVERLTGGVSADVYRLDLSTRDAGRRSVVLRVHGATHSGHPATLEYELLQALHNAGVPVAEPLGLDVTGEIIPEPYLMMAFVDEASTSVQVDNATYFQQLAAVLREIHNAPVQALPALPVRSDPVPELIGFLPEEAKWRRVREFLRELGAAPYRGPHQLLHGDFWPENLLWRRGELAAILDWEDAATGDPLSDVACCRLELRYLYGQEGVEIFTRAYFGGDPSDLDRLALWQLYVASAAHKYMVHWGLPPEKESHMHEVALMSMDEAAARLAGM